MTVPQPRWLRTLSWSAAYGVALVVLYGVAVCTPVGQAVDGMSMGVFAWMPAGGQRAASWFRDELPLVLMLLVIIGAVAALFRRRPWHALSCLLVPYLMVWLNTGLRDHLLVRPHYGQPGYQHNTFPSGHVTGTMVVCVSLMVLAALWMRHPSHQRTLAAVAWIVTTAVAVSSVAVYAHRVSDVFGGAMLAGAVAVWLLPPGRLPPLRDVVRAPPVWMAAIALGAVVVVSVVLSWAAGTNAWFGIAVVTGSGLTCAAVIQPAAITLRRERADARPAGTLRPEGGRAPRTRRPEA